MRKCVLFNPIGLCVNIIDDPENTYVPPAGYDVSPDPNGQLYWYWDGDEWQNPYDVLFNAYLGESPTVDTADVSDESNRVATTFYVRQKIEDYINTNLSLFGTINGGSFGDAPVPTIYDAGYFNNTGSNFTVDLISPYFDNTGGNLTADITADAY